MPGDIERILVKSTANAVSSDYRVSELIHWREQRTRERSSFTAGTSSKGQLGQLGIAPRNEVDVLKSLFPILSQYQSCCDFRGAAAE